MEKKRYQVFISSTYSDLTAERVAVANAVTQMDCISAGMESFPALDEEQIQYVKRVSDDSDYYVLVIAGRYGSLNSNKSISFTEAEYNYAVSKGLPVLTFIHGAPESIPVGKTDQNKEKREKLLTFKAKVKRNRLVKFGIASMNCRSGLRNP